MNPKVVLAYSGGLDTSVILTWLQDRSYHVIAYIADVGQHEDLAAAEDKALKTGASTVYREDLKRDFVEDYIFTAIKADYAAAFVRVFLEFLRIETLGIDRAAQHIGNGDDHAAQTMQNPNRMPTNVPEALHRHAQAGWVQFEFTEHRFDNVDYALSRGVLATQRTT